MFRKIPTWLLKRSEVDDKSDGLLGSQVKGNWSALERLYMHLRCTE